MAKKVYTRAFPVPENSDEPGMSLRDYFAGQVLAGLSVSRVSVLGDEWDVSLIANQCYEVANAMIAARMVQQ